MTQYEDENIFAMATDSDESHLIAGDTIGVISVFCLQYYCNSAEVDIQCELYPV